MKKILITMIVLPCALLAETYYVGGEKASDTGSGSEKSPWATLKKAVSKVKAGDTVIVAPGTYPEAVVITGSGTADQQVIFRAEPARQAKVQSFRVNADYVTIEGFEVTNDADKGLGIHCGEAYRENARRGCRIINNYIHGIKETAIYTGEKALVKDNTIRNVFRGIFANSGTLVENNEVDTLVPQITVANGVEKAKKTQYTFFSGDDITFRGNYLHGAPENYLIKGMGVCFFASWDTWKYPPSNRILIEGNRCFNATHASEPMATKKQSSHITYRNNLFVNTVYVGVMPKGFEYVTIENNTFINCGAYPVWLQNNKQCETAVVRNNLISYIARERVVEAHGWKEPDAGIRFDTQGPKPVCDNNLIFRTENRNYGPNDFTAEPQFIDPASGDYRLKPGSPGIDAGATIEEIKTDLLGTPRPQGAAYDIGAYETK